MNNLSPKTNWQATSLDALAEYINGYAFKPSDWHTQGFPIIRIAQITGSSANQDFYKGILPDCYLLNTGDLIFSWSGTLEVVLWKNGPAWLNQHLFKVVPKKGLDRSFLFHLLKWHVEEMSKRAHGSTMKHIKRKELKEFQTSIPSSEIEQKAIATVLDTINEAIAAAEAQLAKQEKIKQGLLQDLLTRGIDQTGQIRPHWEDRPDLYKKTELGLIPIAWEINLLGNICARGGGNVQTGPFGSQLHAEDYKDQGIPIITVEHLNELFISHKNLPLVGNEDYFRLRKYDLETGDLVFSRVGAIDRCSYVTEQENGWLFSGRCLRVRAGNSINSKYLAFVLNSHRQRQWILNAAVGSTMACLNTSILSNVPVTEPAEYEQKFVADNLFEVTSVANELKADVRKLQSIKTGLMQDLLTGQRRVTPELIRQAETGNA